MASVEEQIAFLMGRAMEPEMNRRVLNYFLEKDNKPSYAEEIRHSAGGTKTEMTVALMKLEHDYNILASTSLQIPVVNPPRLVDMMHFYIDDDKLPHVKKFLPLVYKTENPSYEIEEGAAPFHV